MKKIILSVGCLFSALAQANNVSSLPLSQRLGAEAGFVYLQQDSGGNTTTVLPFLNMKVLNYQQWTLNAQLGATGYKDEATGKTFGIAALRLNPGYQFSDKLSVEGLLGVQAWEGKGGAKADIGARANYDVTTISEKWVDDAYVGGGTISHDDATLYLTVGLKKWF